MKIGTAAIILVLCGASFTFGVIFRHKELPPYGQLQELVRTLKSKETPKMAEFSLNTEAISRSLGAMSADIEATREALKSRVILPADRVAVTSRDIDAGQVEISAQIYGMKTRSILAKAPQDATCLRVYIQGHGRDPFDHAYHNSLRARSVEQGCDFLSMSMLGLGLNKGPAEFPSGKYQGQTTSMDWREAHRHGSFLLFRDQTLPEYDHLALFLTPHYYKIRSLLDGYEDVSVMGISGGGWYTVWMAALIPEVDYSIVYAGSLPLVYRTSEAFFADFEEIASPVYFEFDYWQLYHLGSRRGENAEERVQYFVFNDRDDCCFMEPSASHFAGIARDLYGGAVKVIVDESVTHEMDVDVIEAIWAENASSMGASL
ncbi:hypothetical protein FGK63_17355 [Ruegeria sediminis]|uniref:Alpha/beta hydrolase n=1 Tax=Ruegeria sediminis TaxID=2583820 RepID=A0ABY2WTJ7_9RHOB|nr:hypothetical protein [Ruegeria sediminis]TMV04848.1 hypothetical protein FGK63_17355 [Ruegeria sediminis]